MAKLSSKVWRNPIYFTAFGFGSGLMPFAPGTWGTLAAIPIYLLLARNAWNIYLTCVIVAFIFGVFISDKVARELGVDDHPGIVWDEIVGYLLTMFLAPNGIFWIITGFILFRLFDIWKPQPIKWVDKHVHGGWGIMLDDLLAAIPAWILMRSIAWLLQ